MIKEATGVASTIEEARQNALRVLNAPQEADVKVEIVQQPKKKILGLFGGADAKVKAYYDDGKSDKKPAPKKDFNAKQKQAPKAQKPDTPAAKPQAKKEQPKPEKASGKVQKEKPAEDKKPQKKAEQKPDLSAIPAKQTDATNYLEDILLKMGFEGARVTVKESGDDFYFEISGIEDFGSVIGRRGETLDALQYVTRLFVNKSDNSNKHVSLDIGDYRERRAETLTLLAQRQASKSIKAGRSFTLEPMNPYERRIVHTAIQAIDGVSSHSVGEGDNRRVVIVPDNARYDRRGGKNYGGRREKRAPYVPETPKEPREQKVDAASQSRYGKIEPKKRVEETADAE